MRNLPVKGMSQATVVLNFARMTVFADDEMNQPKLLAEVLGVVEQVQTGVNNLQSGGKNVFEGQGSPSGHPAKSTSVT